MTTLFHGTDSTNAATALRDGLLPRPPWRQFPPDGPVPAHAALDGTYLTSSLEYALQNAYKVALEGSLELAIIGGQVDGTLAVPDEDRLGAAITWANDARSDHAFVLAMHKKIGAVGLPDKSKQQLLQAVQTTWLTAEKGYDDEAVEATLWKAHRYALDAVCQAYADLALIPDSHGVQCVRLPLGLPAKAIKAVTIITLTWEGPTPQADVVKAIHGAAIARKAIDSALAALATSSRLG